MLSLRGQVEKKSTDPEKKTERKAKLWWGRTGASIAARGQGERKGVPGTGQEHRNIHARTNGKKGGPDRGIENVEDPFSGGKKNQKPETSWGKEVLSEHKPEWPGRGG